jgi:1-acyl-sn-glycerol-3-phosphate acyltransferase
VIQFIRNLGHLIYKGWFYLVTAIPVFVCAPILLVGVLSERTYPLLYWVARSIWSPFILFMMGTPIRKVEGSLELPPSPFVVVASHTSMLDIMLLLRICKRPVVFVGKEELGRIWLFGFFYKRAAILVNRSSKESRKRVYERVRQKLHYQRSIAIYPEGGVPHVSVDLDRFKDGAFSMAIEHDLPLVPIVNFDCKKRLNWELFEGGPGILRYTILETIPAKTFKVDQVEDFKQHVRNRMLEVLKSDEI